MATSPITVPASQGLEAVLPTQSKATSPAMSNRPTKQKESLQPLEGIRPDDVLGQFSYAPATQTTVVTTTTTTTTNFPPILMKAPQHLFDLDPKLYPLASSPTPISIKKLCFDVDGTPTLFQEADNTLQTLEKVCNFKESYGTRWRNVLANASYPFTAQAPAESLDSVSWCSTLCCKVGASFCETETRRIPKRRT